MSTSRFVLWGIDRSFGSDASLSLCLPVMVDGTRHVHPTKKAWNAGDDLVPYESDGDLHTYAQPVTTSEPVGVPEGTSVMVMGPHFATALEALGVPLPGGGFEIDRKQRLWLAPAPALEAQRERFSSAAHRALTRGLGRALWARKRRRPYDIGDLPPARDVLVHAACVSREELRLLDLVLDRLRPDHGETYTENLRLASARLGMPQGEIHSAVTARIDVLLESVPPERSHLASGHAEMPSLPRTGYPHGGGSSYVVEP